MKEKMLELFEYIHETSDSREEKLKKLEKLNKLLLFEINNMLLSDEIKDKKELEDLKIVFTYIYYNFNSLYDLNNKYEKGFELESDYLGVYIGRFDVDSEKVKLLDKIIDLIGTNFFGNNKLEVYEAKNLENLEILRLKKVYK